jgi:hypothetical protein
MRRRWSPIWKRTVRAALLCDGDARSVFVDLVLDGKIFLVLDGDEHLDGMDSAS